MNLECDIMLVRAVAALTIAIFAKLMLRWKTRRFPGDDWRQPHASSAAPRWNF